MLYFSGKCDANQIRYICINFELNAFSSHLYVAGQ